MKVNYHTHCHYCDGKGAPESYIIAALEKGFSSLGFSSHAPLKETNDWTLKDDNVEEYLAEINNLKDKYRGKIEIHTGLEIDYYPDENRFNTFKKYKTEYTIGSVHMVKPEGHDKYYSVDESEAIFRDVLESVFPDIESFTREYYKNIRALIEQGGYDILGHFDLIKKFNKGDKFFREDEPWYKEEVIKTLDTLTDKDIIVEVNTGAISRGVQNTPYPSKWILKECYNRGIKICLNSDVHHPDNIECFFDEAMDMIKSCGYTELHTPFEIIKI